MREIKVKSSVFEAPSVELFQAKNFRTKPTVQVLVPNPKLELGDKRTRKGRCKLLICDWIW
jgi:hypothetical protein